MKHKFIFDLSEVLIAGLVGIETKLAPLILVPEGEILKYFGGQLLEEICCGTITEEVYLEKIVQGQAWDISVDALKKLIRANFHDEVRGTKTVMKQLAANHEVVLLSDHAKEWIDYIQMIHPFIGNFRQTFFSYQLGKPKKIQRYSEKFWRHWPGGQRNAG